MLGIEPSDVLKHSEDLKSHARLEGIEKRTLLSDRAIGELLEDVRKKLKDMVEESGMEMEELAIAAKLNREVVSKMISGQRVQNLRYSNLEKILQVLNSDTIHFFEEIEQGGKFNIHAEDLSFLKMAKQGPVSIQRMRARISKIREMMLPFYSPSQFDWIIFGNRKIVPRDISFRFGW